MYDVFSELYNLSSRISVVYDCLEDKDAVIPQTRDTWHLSTSIDSLQLAVP